jgi:hypothetical protein
MTDGAGCEPILPAGDCTSGTRPAIGDVECQPVGVRSCPSGFAVHPSGYGCEEVLPPKACSGATLEVLGRSDCQPIGDCNAFPPANATIFVSAAYAPAQLDSTHFASVREAVINAPADAVVAVESGTYKESILVSKGVTIVGRCAEKVIMQTADEGKSGLFVESIPGAVKVSGLTFRGFPGGLAIGGGSNVTLDSVLVEDSSIAGGLVSRAANLTMRHSAVRGTRSAAGESQGAGLRIQKDSQLVLEDSVLADNAMGNLQVLVDGSAHVVRSVLRDGQLLTEGENAGKIGAGAMVREGGNLTIEQSVVRDNFSDGIIVSNGASAKTPRANCTIRDSVFRFTKVDPNLTGRDLEVDADSTAQIENTTVHLRDEVGLFATKATSLLQIRDVTVIGSSTETSPRVAAVLATEGGHIDASSIAMLSIHSDGLVSQSSATVTAEGFLVRDGLLVAGTRREGAFGGWVDTKGTLVAKRGFIERAAGAALGASDGTATFEDVVISDTQPDNFGGDGLAVTVQDGALIELTRAAMLRNHEASIVVFEDSKLRLRDTTISETGRVGGSNPGGHGVLLFGGSRADIAGTTIHKSFGSGIAAVRASGFIERSFISMNPVGVSTQDCRVVSAAASVDDTDLIGVSPDTRFIQNGTRVGAGPLPLDLLPISR